MAQQPSTFLWIHKDTGSKSLSNSKSEHSQNSQIHRHVRSQRSSKPRKSVLPRRPTLEWHRRHSSQTASTPRTESTPSSGEEDQSDGFSVIDTSSTSASSNINQDIGLPKHLIQRWTNPTNRGITPSGNSFDPFSSFPVDLNLEMLRGLWYFESTWVPSAFQSPSNKDSLQIVQQDQVTQLVQKSLADELHINSLLAAVAMRMQTVHGTHSSMGQSTAQQYAAKALKALRNYIQSGGIITEQHAVDILFLAAYELYCFNLVGTRSHLQALKASNAETLLSGYTRTLCRNIDLFSATASLTRPVMLQMGQDQQPERFSQHPLLHPPPLDSPMGSAFPFQSDILGIELLQVIQEIILCAHAAEDCREQLSNIPADEQQDIQELVLNVVEWSENLSFRLVCQMPQSHESLGEKPTVIKECCCIALLMWLSYLPVGMMSHGERSKDSHDYRKMVPGRGSGLVSRLASLNIMESKHSKYHSDLILWILAVGIVCAVDSDDTEWCAQTFMQLAKELQILTYEELSEYLGRYLWLDNFDVVDTHVMASLLDPETQTKALRTVVGWAFVTKYMPVEKKSLTRITNRPSNWYRLGA